MNNGLLKVISFLCFIKVIDHHKEDLEAQLVCWEQVQSGEEEVRNWVSAMVSKLDDSLRHFDDAVSVESRLNKFKVSHQLFFLLLLFQISVHFGPTAH